MRFLGIIPCRKGSKGVPGKNTRKLNGLPLVSYSIRSALGVDDEDFDLVVTTNCSEVTLIAEQLGVRTIRRPECLADDDALMVDVVHHALDNSQRSYEAVVLLQPTCPFRTTEHISETISILKSMQYASVISYSEVGDNHPSRMYRFDSNLAYCVEPDGEKLNRQELPKTFKRNGLIYGVTTKRFVETNSFFHVDAKPLIIKNNFNAINIDEEIDFFLAESVAKEINRE
jgi:CMP-N,N'-diacetyllegionaminic acid synthase